MNAKIEIETTTEKQEEVVLQADGARTGAGLRGAFGGLRGALCGVFLEREREIDGLLCALVARQHVLLLGDPGTGKSALTNALCGSIDGSRYFQWLMTRYTTPEELFGPVSLSALKADKFQRVPTGKLPEGNIAFLDEVWKANSAILNSLLTIVNERKWHNNGGAVAVPLEILVGASNELPEGEELSALYDRFLLRFWVEPLKSDGSFATLLLSDEPVLPAGLITLDEVHAAQAEAKALPLSRAVAERLAELRREIAGAGLPQASDRRWKQCVSLLRARAWLAGDAAVSLDHFDVLAHALWSDPEQRSEIAKIVSRYTASTVAEARKVYDAITDLIARMPKAEDRYLETSPTVSREGRKAEDKLRALAESATTQTSRDAIGALIEEAVRALAPVRDAAARSIGMKR
jgi:MoxR-like ATPase